MSAGLPRTYLYVPGNAGDKLAKALTRGADALILDLEDAVPVAEKDAARDAVVAWLGSVEVPAGIELWVRINPGERGDDDARALAGLPALTGLALAKADAADVARVASVLEEAGDSGEAGTVLMPLIETPAAWLDALAVAAAPRVHRLQVGEVDLTGEAGITPGPDEVELLAVRTQVVMASAAAGIAPPVGPVSRLVHDTDALAASTRHVTRLGFVGRACIHPAQVAVVHEVVTPTDADAAEAQQVLDSLAEAEARGTAVLLDAQGRLVDPAVMHSARRVLDLHARAARG